MGIDYDFIKTEEAKYLSDFYDRNGIEELYEIDDAEY